MSLCTVCVQEPTESPGQGMLDPSELELQVVVSYHVSIRKQTWVLFKSSQHSSHRAIS